MKQSLRATVAALILTIVPSFVLADFDFGDYARDRAHDFADIFRLRAGVPSKGKGYGAKARVTALAQAGYVHFDGSYTGMMQRGIGVTREDRTEGGVSLFYASRHRTNPSWTANEFLSADTLWSEVEDRRILLNLPYWDDGRGDLLGVGAEVATPILAIDVGVYPSQVLDFCTGFVLIDLFNDDQMNFFRQYPYSYQPIEQFGIDEDDTGAEDKIMEIDAIKSAIEQKRLEEEGQMGESEGSESVDEPSGEGMMLEREEPAEVELGDEPLDREDLEAIDEESVEETFQPRNASEDSTGESVDPPTEETGSEVEDSEPETNG